MGSGPIRPGTYCPSGGLWRTTSSSEPVSSSMKGGQKWSTATWQGPVEANDPMELRIPPALWENLKHLSFTDRVIEAEKVKEAMPVGTSLYRTSGWCFSDQMASSRHLRGKAAPKQSVGWRASVLPPRPGVRTPRTHNPCKSRGQRSEGTSPAHISSQRSSPRSPGESGLLWDFVPNL